MYELEENKVQEFALQKINNGLSKKSIKDILIVLKNNGDDIKIRSKTWILRL